jgi:hypothetical protein
MVIGAHDALHQAKTAQGPPWPKRRCRQVLEAGAPHHPPPGQNWFEEKREGRGRSEVGTSCTLPHHHPRKCATRERSESRWYAAILGMFAFPKSQRASVIRARWGRQAPQAGGGDFLQNCSRVRRWEAARGAGAGARARLRRARARTGRAQTSTTKSAALTLNSTTLGHCFPRTHRACAWLLSRAVEAAAKPRNPTLFTLGPAFWKSYGGHKSGNSHEDRHRPGVACQGAEANELRIPQQPIRLIP